MYKKYLIITHKDNPAGMNIVNNLEQFTKNPFNSSGENTPFFDTYITEKSALYEENLHKEKISNYDFVIFAYTHKSEKGEKSLSIHAPGNWRFAELGGKEGLVSPTSALFQKHMFELLVKNSEKYDLDKRYNMTLEVTHHGPLIDKPCIFIEIGSSEKEWNDRRAGFVVAKTISEAVETFKDNPYREIAIGLGGPHYCPNFNKLQLKSNIAISYIIPNYVAPITEEMILEAVDKTEEELDFAILDWKGLGTSEQRQRVIDLLEKNYIQWKKTSDTDKD